MGDGRSDRSDGADRSVGSGGSSGRLRSGGGYRQLRSFRVATLIYDATVSFCDRFVNRRSRTHDQMVQAARSGRQNIAEGSRASTQSSQTELRLVGVARASLDELLLDYEDFLRQRGLRLWLKDDRESRKIRSLGYHQPDPTDRTDRTDPSDPFGPYARFINHRNPVIVANTIICLIHQANFLLDRQIAALERDFIEEGGYTERLAAARMAHRTQQPDLDAPTCPKCGQPMVLRTARQGAQAGRPFWGCSTYPDCRATVPVN